jgi:hypothetical protein
MNTVYKPAKGERFIWVHVTLRNLKTVARKFNFDRCDLTPATRSLSRLVDADDVGGILVTREPQLGVNEYLERRLIYATLATAPHPPLLRPDGHAAPAVLGCASVRGRGLEPPLSEPDPKYARASHASPPRIHRILPSRIARIARITPVRNQIEPARGGRNQR